MFRTSLLTALLLSSAALAEGPVVEAGEARRQIRESLARVQSAVVKARDERHPVKLTCAANAEEHLATLVETNSEAVAVAADEEAAMTRCLAAEDQRDAPKRVFFTCYEPSATAEEPLFRDPPEVSFNRPIR